MEKSDRAAPPRQKRVGRLFVFHGRLAACQNHVVGVRLRVWLMPYQMINLKISPKNRLRRFLVQEQKMFSYLQSAGLFALLLSFVGDIAKWSDVYLSSIITWNAERCPEPLGEMLGWLHKLHADQRI
jgi:hypothetical protein